MNMIEHRDEKGRLAMAQSAIAKRLRKKGGVITDKTQRWRVAARGEDRSVSEMHEAAMHVVRGGTVSDKYKTKLLRTQLGKKHLRNLRKSQSPEAWDRRRLASKPGAQFDSKGSLSNYEEMKRRHG